MSLPVGTDVLLESDWAIWDKNKMKVFLCENSIQISYFL